MACYVLSERSRCYWEDSDSNEAVDGDKGTLSTSWVLVRECLRRDVGANLVKSVVPPVSEGCCCLSPVSCCPFLVALAPLAPHKLASTELRRELEAEGLSQQLYGFLFIFVEWQRFLLEGRSMPSSRNKILLLQPYRLQHLGSHCLDPVHLCLESVEACLSVYFQVVDSCSHHKKLSRLLADQRPDCGRDLILDRGL